MITKLALIVAVIGVATAKPQGASLDDLISQIFAASTTVSPVSQGTTAAPVIDAPLRNTDNCPGGECVQMYLCSNNTIIRDGTGIIDIRFDDGTGVQRQCVDYLETCCESKDIGGIATPPPVSPNSGCGIRNVDGVGFRITGNKNSESEYGEFPWMCAILKEEKAIDQTLNVYQCGGALIHPSVVITAAHCVSGKEPQILKVRAGEWDTQTKNELWPHQDRQVVDMVVHPDYYKGALYNDVALLFLSEPVDISETVNTLCLPPQNFNFDNNKCFASGWGKDLFGKEGKYQVIMKKVQLPVVPKSQCQNSLRGTRLGKNFELHNSFICAGGEAGLDTCKGDGGSPLVCPVPGSTNQFYHAGIVAWGIGCGENNVPGVYVNVPLFRNWIDQQMAAKNYPTSYYTA